MNTPKDNSVKETKSKRKNLFTGEPGPGRPKGIPNKSTTQAREAIAKLVDGNADRLQEWLDRIADDEKQGPAVAFKLLMDVMEYHIPKLARTEMIGDGGGAVRHEIEMVIVDPSAKSIVK